MHSCSKSKYRKSNSASRSSLVVVKCHLPNRSALKNLLEKTNFVPLISVKNAWSTTLKHGSVLNLHKTDCSGHFGNSRCHQWGARLVRDKWMFLHSQSSQRWSHRCQLSVFLKCSGLCFSTCQFSPVWVFFSKVRSSKSF